MFEKFGELNSFGETNELAENLFNEGDTESLRAMAKENGIQSDFVDMYLQGEIPVLCDQLTAALGKIDVEVAELKPKEVIEAVYGTRKEYMDRLSEQGMAEYMADEYKSHRLLVTDLENTWNLCKWLSEKVDRFGQPVEEE